MANSHFNSGNKKLLHKPLINGQWSRTCIEPDPGFRLTEGFFRISFIHFKCQQSIEYRVYVSRFSLDNLKCADNRIQYLYESKQFATNKVNSTFILKCLIFKDVKLEVS